MRRFPFVVLLVLALALPVSAAHGKPRWSEGPLKTEILNVNCSSLIFGTPYLEHEIGAYLGQRVDNRSPVVGETFDIHLVVATIGSNCSGTRPQLEIALPPGVKPAQGRPGIRCFLQESGANKFKRVSASQGCPRRLRRGTTSHRNVGRWYSLDPGAGTPHAPAWKMPKGTFLEVRVPVVASRKMNGIADKSGCPCVVAAIKTINGTSMPEPDFSFRGSVPSKGPFISLFAFAGPRLKAPRNLKLSKKPRVPITGLRAGDRVVVHVKARGRIVGRGQGKTQSQKLLVRLGALNNPVAREVIRNRAKAKISAEVIRRGKRIPVKGRTVSLG